MTKPLLIEDVNLSEAWIKVLKYIADNPGREISPLILSITDFNEIENVRKKLDSMLISNGNRSIQTVSETIFPNSLYQYCGKKRHTLYKEYCNNLPRIKSIDKKANGKGTYFERLIAYEGNSRIINQLEIIISSLNIDSNVKRRSKLQASIFNPEKDHIDGMFQGFPCLQHITFYKSDNKGLVLNSFYAVQYLYQRAYGNWLGLINLGKFVANELDIKFERFNCYVGVEKLDNLKKVDAKRMLTKLQINNTK